MNLRRWCACAIVLLSMGCGGSTSDPSTGDASVGPGCGATASRAREALSAARERAIPRRAPAARRSEGASPLAVRALRRPTAVRSAAPTALAPAPAHPTISLVPRTVPAAAGPARTVRARRSTHRVRRPATRAARTRTAVPVSATTAAARLLRAGAFRRATCARSPSIAVAAFATSGPAQPSESAHHLRPEPRTAKMESTERCATGATAAAVVSVRRPPRAASTSASQRVGATSTATFVGRRATAVEPPAPAYRAMATSCATSLPARRSAFAAIRWAAIPRATSATTRTTRAASRPRETTAARLRATPAFASSTR